MKKIIKTQSPVFFEDWRNADSNNTWEKLGEIPNNNQIKRPLKEFLLKEQGGICCYCGQKVVINNSVLEHLKPREIYKSLKLEYSNLLISCEGGKKDRTIELDPIKRKTIPLYCDSSKGNNEIPITPLDTDCESKFKFGIYGEIFDDGSEESIDTINKLNLGNTKLNNSRKNAIAGYYNQDDDVDTINLLIQSLEQKDSNGNYAEFCHQIINFLESII